MYSSHPWTLIFFFFHMKCDGIIEFDDDPAVSYVVGVSTMVLPVFEHTDSEANFSPSPACFYLSECSCRMWLTILA